MLRETHTRAVAKALSWRIIGTVAATLLVFGFRWRLTVSLAVQQIFVHLRSRGIAV
jgi:hypothetical protein